MDDKIIIRLNGSEILLAGQIGILRMIHVITKGRNHTHGSKDSDNWQRHIEGALGEYSVSKHLNLFWNGTVGYIDKADIGDYEVRTAFEHDRRLILHPEDKDDRLFVFVTGGNGIYWIRGWILCSEGKQQKYWDDPTRGNRYAFFVPVSVLNPMSTFPKNNA